MLMAQQLTDLAQRCSMSEHFNGQRVSEYMCACVRRVHSSVGQGSLDERRDACRICKTNSWCMLTNKHTTARTTRPPILQICSDRTTDVRWQRHLSPSPALPTHRQMTSVPIDIVERHGDNFARSQA